MKYCGNCGSQMNDGSKYCGECGAEFGKDEITRDRENDSTLQNNLKSSNESNDNSLNTDRPVSKKSSFRWWKVPLWIFFFPFMAIYTVLRAIIKTKRVPNKLKPVLIILFFYMLGASFSALGRILPDEPVKYDGRLDASYIETMEQGSKISNKDADNSQISAEPSEAVIREEVVIKGIEDNTTSKNIIKASDLIGMKITSSSNIEKKDPWAGGDRYSLNYEGNQVLIYMNGDNSVNSINVGDIKVYEAGYEPLHIEDYLTNTEMDVQITIMAKDLIKMTLNYPDTAKFPWLDWGYERADNIYAVSSHVEAKNAFGVQSTIPFYIEFELNETSTKPVYVVLDGKVVAGDKSQMKAPEKVKLPEEVKPENEDGSFEIKDGELGAYGKKEMLDGKEYIYYYIPEGKYKVTTTMNVAAVMVLKRDPYKNSDGYLEHEIVSMNRFESNSDVKEITVNADEKVMVTINSMLKFTPLK